MSYLLITKRIRKPSPVQTMQESVTESLLDAKSAIEELKDLLEDDKQKEDGN